MAERAAPAHPGPSPPPDGAAPRRSGARASVLGRASAAWALFGVCLLFGFAVFRLGRRGLATVSTGLTPGQWAILVFGTAFFVYTEGVVALQRRWVPRLVERARELRGEARPVFRMLAPLYGMSLIGASRRRMGVAWIGTAAIVAAVVVVRGLPEPWRGIVDVAVAAALAWALIPIARSLPRVST